MSAPLSLMGLAWVLREFETRLTTGVGSNLGLQIIDRIDIPNASPAQIAHKGVGVGIFGTTNTHQYRDATYARVEDTVTVTLTYRIRPQDQRTSRDEAIRLEEQIRAILCDGTWLRDTEIRYAGTSVRGPHPKSADFFLIVQLFTTARDAALGEA